MNSKDAEVEAFRRFNRMYTRFLGALQEGLLNTEYTLTEARVLYEIATRPGSKAGEIAASLEMDAGYLSRLLGKFESRNLLKRTAAAEDNRASALQLTSGGRRAFQKLNDRSNAQAGEVLKALPPAARTRLIHHLQAVQAILAPSEGSRPPYVLRPPRAGDMGWVVSRQGASYAEEHGWDVSFEALVARIVAEFVSNFDAARERCWIAEIEGESAGHIFLVRDLEHPLTAKLRLLFVEPSARGMGLGGVLVNECVRFARSAGYSKVTLWTQSMLTAAGRIYRKAGFQIIEQHPNVSFGKELVSQTWELKLK